MCEQRFGVEKQRDQSPGQARLTGAFLLKTRPYSRYFSVLLILGGILDPLYGLVIKIVDLVWRPRLPRLSDTARRRQRGLTLILGGIEGPSLYNYQIVCGLLRSGYRGSVVRFDWNDGVPFWRSLVNLMSGKHHKHQALLVVDYILRYKHEHPDAPVCLIAQSGGCWITVRALEALPPKTNVETAVLLAPAISPAYDIKGATAKCASGLISVGSAGDFFFLGLGTLLLGTSDRHFTPSAGFVGWHYVTEGFVEARWHPRWIKHGYVGNHTSSSAIGFIASVIGPRLAARFPQS
ncbi:MAG: hypothetical protein MI923_09935 [Phycisphaerales bacterium]|nr:hypothetical protein [Phycisphaerales bacterium]